MWHGSVLVGENWEALAIGLVACRGIDFCDDSPFAYIFSCAAVLVATFAYRWGWEERAISCF